MLKKAFILLLNTLKDKKDMTEAILPIRYKYRTIALTEIGLGVTSISGIFIQLAYRRRLFQ